MPMVRVLIADDIARIVDELDKLSEHTDRIDVCGIARRPASLFEEARALQPDVILLNENFGRIDVLAAAQELRTVAPDSRLILVAADPQRQQRALRHGVSQIVPASATPAELVAALLQPLTAGAAVTSATGWTATEVPSAPPAWIGGDVPVVPQPDTETAANVSAPPEMPAPPPAVEPPPPAPASEAEIETEPELEPIQEIRPRRPRRNRNTKGELFVIFAGKGGVGKSMVTANLAVALSTRTQGRVGVIDLDLQFGDVGVMLGVDHQHTIENLAQHGEQVDTEILEEVLAPAPEDVRVLLAPPSPELADLVTAASLRAIVREMTRAFDYVVVDAPAHLEERTLEVIEAADHIIIVTAFNVTAVKDTKIMLKLLQSLGIEKERIAVVLNQTRPRTTFTREEVEESLRFRVVTHLPYDSRAVDDAIDHGKPFYLADSKADITKQFRVLVDYLVPDAGVAEPATSGDQPPGGRMKAKANRRRFSLGRGS